MSLLFLAGLAPVVLITTGVGLWLLLRLVKARQRRLLDEGWRRLESDPPGAATLLLQFIAQQKRRVKGRDPLLYRAYLGLALACIHQKSWQKAEQAEAAARKTGDIGPDDLMLLCDAYVEASADDPLPDAGIDALARYLLLPDEARSEKPARRYRKVLRAALTVAHEADAGTLASAIRRGERILKAGIKEAWVYSALGALCYRAGQLPEAIKHLKKALGLAPDVPADLLTLGLALRKSGDRRESRKTLLLAYRHDKNDPAIAFEAARACLRWPDEPLTAEEAPGKSSSPLEAARDLLERVVKKLPDYAPAWLELGDARIRLDLLQDATAALEKAVALDPKLPGAQAQLGRCWLARGDKQKAQTALARALELHPNIPETVRLAGDLAYHDDRYADALAQYRRLGPQAQEDLTLLERLARCYLETGVSAKAAELLADAPLERPSVRMLLGRARARLNQWKVALETLHALPADRMAPEYRYYYAAALAANGKHADAESIFLQLAALPDWQARANRQLGHLKVMTQDYRSAKNYYGTNHQPASNLDLGRLALVERDLKTAQRHFDEAAKGGAPAPAVRAGLAVTRALTGDASAFDALLNDPDLAPWANEEIGQRPYRGHRFLEALANLEKAAKGRAHLSSTLICQLANSYLALNRYGEALPHLLELSQRYPRLVAVRHNLALCRFQLGQGHFRRGQWDLARQEWNRASHLLKPVLPEVAQGIHRLELEASYRMVAEVLGGEKSDELEKAQNICEIACKEAPTEPRWWFAAGLAAALRDQMKRAAECFIEARKLDKDRVSFTLGASLSFLAQERHDQARLTLEKTLELAEADKDPAHALFPVATRFALTTTYAKKKMWKEAANVLEPLLTHPMVRSSSRLQPADVAQAMVAYHGLAGNRERAADLAKKYLGGQGSVGNLLIGLVQAEGGDYAGAAETLEAAYQQDPNPKIAAVLVGCLLAEAARLILEGDLKAAGPIVRYALKIDPKHPDAKKLEAALSFGSKLKELDAKQLDKTIEDCETLISEGGETSAQLTRTLGVLYHRKALQAEKRGKNVEEAWDACVKYWKKRIFARDGFWKQFEEEYNQGKGKRERIKPDDLAKWRKDLPIDLARDHAAYTSHFIRTWDKKNLQRHLGLIWDWAPDWVPPQEFLLVDLQNADDAKLDFFAEIRNQVKNENLRKILGELAAGSWNRKGLAKMDLAIDQANRAISLANTSVALVNSLGGAAYAIRSQVIDALRTAANLLSNARDNCREALGLCEKANSLAPSNNVYRDNCVKIRDEQRKINENYDTVNGLLRQIGG